MKSPRRLALRPRNRQEDMLLKDPDYLAKKETERRRQLRYVQVRQRSMEAARTVRQRVKREQLRQVNVFSKLDFSVFS